MENYKLIIDEQAVVDTINYLPNNDNDEVYLLCLFSRKKYAVDPSSCPSESMLKRTACKKEHILNSLKQMEVAKGCYTTKDGRPVPEESMCVYINPNPRCLKRARWDTVREIMRAIEQGHEYCNPKSVAMRCIHKARKKKIFVDFDIDMKNIDLSLLNDIFPLNDKYGYYRILETRGGYHVLVDTRQLPLPMYYELGDRSVSQNWYESIRKSFEIDQAGDELLPFPGCIQGGFVPKWV